VVREQVRRDDEDECADGHREGDGDDVERVVTAEGATVPLG
jgi:hypothetical protein